jgi:hypothetical protein
MKGLKMKAVSIEGGSMTAVDIEKYIDSRLKHELANIRRWTGSQNIAHFGSLDSDAPIA